MLTICAQYEEHLGINIHVCASCGSYLATVRMLLIPRHSHYIVPPLRKGINSALFVFVPRKAFKKRRHRTMVCWFVCCGLFVCCCLPPSRCTRWCSLLPPSAACCSSPCRGWHTHGTTPSSWRWRLLLTHYTHVVRIQTRLVNRTSVQHSCYIYLLLFHCNQRDGQSHSVGRKGELDVFQD